MQLEKWLWLSALPQVGTKRLLSLWEESPDFSHWLDQGQYFKPSAKLLAKLASFGALKNICVTDLIQDVKKKTEYYLTWLNSCDSNFILAIDDDNYPDNLRQIKDPPPIIFGQGDYKLLNSPQIAIVGTRSPSQYGVVHAQRFAKALATSFIITSGLARGVDKLAAQAALDAGGKTIAVLGSGLNNIYPPNHKSLAKRISANGLVISEFAPDIAPHKLNFPRRNRIISGLTYGVLVIEAAIKSGSLITADYALEQGREVFAIPGSIDNPLAKGCHHLIRQGAKCVDSVQDLLDELGAHNLALSKFNCEPKKGLILEDENQQKVVDAIGSDFTPIDLIVEKTKIAVHDLNILLLEMELTGIVAAVPGGYKLVY